MRSINPILLPFSLMFILALASCQKDAAQNPDSDKLLPSKIVLDNSGEKIIAAFSYNNQNQINTFTLTANSYYYADQEHKGIFITSYTYHDNKLVKTESQDKQTGKIFSRDSIIYEERDVAIFTTDYEVDGYTVYNTSKKLYSLDNSSKLSTLVEKEVDSTSYNYDSNSHLIGITHYAFYYGSVDWITDLRTFDDKKGPYFCVNMPQWFLQTFDLKLCIGNNYTKTTETDVRGNDVVNAVFTYTYNSQGYPIKILKNSDDGESSIISIDYINAE